MRPTLTTSLSRSLVEVCVVTKVYFNDNLSGSSLLATSRKGTVVADVVTRNGFTYNGCPLMLPGGCYIPPDAPSTAPESLASFAQIFGNVAGVEAVLLFASDEVGPGARPYVLMNSPVGDSFFPPIAEQADVNIPVPVPGGVTYTRRWVRDIILHREYLTNTAEFVLSALGGAVFPLTGVPFQVQLTGVPQAGSKFQIQLTGDLNNETVLLGNATVAYLDVIASKMTALDTFAAAVALETPALAAAAEALIAITVPLASLSLLKSGVIEIPIFPELL